MDLELKYLKFVSLPQLNIGRYRKRLRSKKEFPGIWKLMNNKLNSKLLNNKISIRLNQKEIIQKKNKQNYFINNEID